MLLAVVRALVSVVSTAWEVINWLTTQVYLIDSQIAVILITTAHINGAHWPDVSAANEDREHHWLRFGFRPMADPKKSGSLGRQHFYGEQVCCIGDDFGAQAASVWRTLISK
jgi:hypothetical protein